MVKINKLIKIFIIPLLIALMAISSYFLIKIIIKDNKQNETLKSIENIAIFSEGNAASNLKIETEAENIDEINCNNKSIAVTQESKKSQNFKENTFNLQKLRNINPDIVGWIKIEGTNINYPIMQNENYYLYKDFYKNDSSYGTPFLASSCNINTSENLIIYGHHAKNGSMFANLNKYKNKNFYKNHRIIKLYTFEDKNTVLNTYEIAYIFKTVAYSDNGFKYYNFYNLQSIEDFDSFILNCRKIQLYDTDVVPKYGDKFITLSTCEYSQKNGRMVIVARKI